jgi:hypothetical protein
MEAPYWFVYDTNVERILGQLMMETGSQLRAILFQPITALSSAALSCGRSQRLADLVYPTD